MQWEYVQTSFYGSVLYSQLINNLIKFKLIRIYIFPLVSPSYAYLKLKSQVWNSNDSQNSGIKTLLLPYILNTKSFNIKGTHMNFIFLLHKLFSTPSLTDTWRIVERRNSEDLEDHIAPPLSRK